MLLRFHNHTIERFWHEINSHVNYPIKACLIDMEAKGDLRRVPMDTAKRIECAFNPVCQHSHESGNSNVHRMRIEFNPLPEVDWKRIETGLHYYSWVTRGYAYHESLACSLAWLFVACGACYIASFCSALAATLGKKEACFLKAEKSGAAW